MKWNIDYIPPPTEETKIKVTNPRKSEKKLRDRTPCNELKKYWTIWSESYWYVTSFQTLSFQILSINF